MIRTIPFLLLFLCADSFASIPVSGYFDATTSCPAYISKNKKTNPDALYIHPSTRHTVQSINRMPPNWVQIIIEGQNPALRWVDVNCGQLHYKEQKKEPCDTSPGLADSHVLALSWQPAFCETYGYQSGKPECLTLPADSYQAQHLVLHGLWPNQSSCGINYGYCGSEKKSRHCSYSPVLLSEKVAQKLKKFMPSYAYGSCLERHEWNRHGVCQILSSDDFFSLAIRLNEELNNSSFGEYLTANVGEVIGLSQLKKEVDNALGDGASRKVFFGCKNNRLVDIHIALPALIPNNASLSDLVEKAASYSRRDGCPLHVKISDFFSKN